MKAIARPFTIRRSMSCSLYNSLWFLRLNWAMTMQFVHR